MKTIFLLFFSTLSWATTITWDLSTPTGDLGPSYTFISSGYSLPVYGFGYNFTPTDLFAKTHDNGSNEPDEHGLGLNVLLDHEIPAGFSIVVDTLGLTNVTFQMESVQPQYGISWEWCAEQTLTGGCYFTQSMVDESIHTFSGGRYLLVTSNGALLGEVTGDVKEGPGPTPTSVPEPGMFPVLALCAVLAVLVLAIFSRKERRKK